MTSLSDLEDEHVAAMAALEEAAARWVETKASGKSTAKVEAEIQEHESATRRLERKIHKLKKRR